MRTAKFHGYTVREDGQIFGRTGRPLKLRENDGRYEARLSIDGVRKSFIAARLVYYAFHPDFDIDDKNLCVVQQDGDKLNIALGNLALKDRKDLIQGDKHAKRSLLTNAQADEIRQLYKGKSGVNQNDKKGYSLKDLADRYGVSKSNIASIVGRRHRHEYKLN